MRILARRAHGPKRRPASLFICCGGMCPEEIPVQSPVGALAGGR